MRTPVHVPATRSNDLEFMTKTVEWYYNNYNVYKSLVVCNSDEEVTNYSVSLRSHYHSAITLVSLDIEDDRDTYIERLASFNKNSFRMIVISYPVYLQIRELLEVYVLPEQNLVVLGNIEDVDEITEWLTSAKSRGFIEWKDCNVLDINTPEDTASIYNL